MNKKIYILSLFITLFLLHALPSYSATPPIGFNQRLDCSLLHPEISRIEFSAFDEFTLMRDLEIYFSNGKKEKHYEVCLQDRWSISCRWSDWSIGYHVIEAELPNEGDLLTGRLTDNKGTFTIHCQK